MAFRVVRQRREARRNAKLDEIFQVKMFVVTHFFVIQTKNSPNKPGLGCVKFKFVLNC